MIAALYQSRCMGGVSNFDRIGTTFGWEAIEIMLKQEVARMKSNQLPCVPGLKENFVCRDSWTRLNVKPAKIMQVLIVQSCTRRYAYPLWMHALMNFFCSYVSKSMCYQSWGSTQQHNRHQQMQAVYWSPLCTLRHVMLFSKGGFSGKVYLLRLWTTPFWKVWLLATNTSPSGWIESWKQVISYIALSYHTSVIISKILQE